MISSVDNDRAVLDPVALDELGSAHSTNDYVGALHDFVEINCARVADGHGGVLVQHHHRHRLAENRAATDDHGFLALQLDVVMI